MSAAGEDRSAALDSVLQVLGETATWPGAGAGAGLVVALAAGLIEGAARRSSESWDGAGGAIAQATSLRLRALRLAGENAEAHIEAGGALATASRAKPQREQEIADIQLGAALAVAAELPLEIAAA